MSPRITMQDPERFRYGGMPSARAGPSPSARTARRAAIPRLFSRMSNSVPMKGRARCRALEPRQSGKTCRCPRQRWQCRQGAVRLYPKNGDVIQGSNANVQILAVVR
jgi:hypothetical protein